MFEDSLLMFPPVHSSEKETLEVLDALESLLDDEDASDDTENLLLLSEEHESQLATLSLPSLAGTPSELPKLSLERRRCPASRSRYWRFSAGYSGGGFK